MTNWDNDDEDLHELWDDEFDSIAPVPEKSYEFLSTRQRELYARHRRKLFRWFHEEGKEPDQGNGYSKSSFRSMSSRIDQFYRWVWQREGFVKRVTTDHADAYIEQQLKTEDWTNTAKRKTVNSIEALLRYFHQNDDSWDGWEPPTTWSDSTFDNPTDYLDVDELEKVRRASLELGDIPKPRNLSESKVEEWRQYLAQYWGIPKAEVGEEEFDLARNYKIPSLVYVSLDTGLRPMEAKRMTEDMLRIPDIGSGKLVIPREDSTKNDDNWESFLTEDATDMVRLWLKEREHFDVYSTCEHCAESEEEIEQGTVDCEHPWLTMRGNPYNSGTLRTMLQRLMKEAGIETESRETGWYTIRRGVATRLANEDDTTLETVMQQLRISRPETAARYVQEDPDHIRDVLSRPS